MGQNSYERESPGVHRDYSEAAELNNCALCDKSMKFGTQGGNHILSKSGCWATPVLTFGDLYVLITIIIIPVF